MTLTKFDYFKTVFCIVCILITIILSSWRVYQYSLDEDLTRVTFKRFHKNKESVYPSITLCFFDQYLQEKLKEFKTNASEYTRFLKGQYWDPKLLKVNYDDVTIDLKEYLLGYDIWYSEKGCMWKKNGKNRFKREEGKRSQNRETIRPKIQIKQQISYNQLDDIMQSPLGWKMPYVSLSEPSQKCFTIDIPFQARKMLRTFNIRIKTSVFRDKTRPSKYVSNVDDGSTDGFMILFNYPNQVLSGVNGIKNWPIRGKNDSKSYVMEFNLQNIEVVHNRRKKRMGCENFPFDQDAKERHKFIEMAGCLPPFLKINNTAVSSCTTKNEMAEAYSGMSEYFANRDDYVENICCRHLTNFGVDYWEYEMTKDDFEYFNITINYNDSKYREIREIKAFTIYSLFGNIGGYVGIFIGYAFFHIPGILLKVRNGMSKEMPTND